MRRLSSDNRKAIELHFEERRRPVLVRLLSHQNLFLQCLGLEERDSFVAAIVEASRQLSGRVVDVVNAS